jgi:hypothetical protein
MVYALFSLPFLGVLIVVAHRASARRRFAYLWAGSVLFLTPALGPATIAVVPVPFGLLLAIGLIGFRLNDTLAIILWYPKWYLISFPATAVASYAFLRWWSARAQHQSRPGDPS